MNKLLFTAVVLIYGMNNAQIHTPTGGINSATTNPQTGNVGIGTDNPQTKLDINGDISFGEAGSNTLFRDNAGSFGSNIRSGFYQTINPINFPNGATSWWHLLDVRHSNSTNNYALQIAGSFFDQNLWFRKTSDNPSQPWRKILAEQSNGNVGIGTDNPIEKLEVNGSIKSNTYFKSSTSDIILTDNNGVVFRGIKYPAWTDNVSTRFFQIGEINDNAAITSFSGNTLNRFMINSTNTQISSGGYSSSNIPTGIFEVSDGTKGLLNVLGNGNVGIGTNDPQTKLDVVGTTKMTGELYLLKNPVPTGDYGSKLYFGDPSENNDPIYISRFNTSNDSQLRINMGDDYGDKFMVGRKFWSDTEFTPMFTVVTDGNVGIGTDTPQTKLDVVGTSSFSDNMKVTAKLEAKEIKVTTTPTADFVFAEDYHLPKLEEVEKHIKDKKHLPEIASAKEMEKEGVNIGEFQIKLLQKIEELTLYSIDQNKQNKLQQDQIKLQQEEIMELKKIVQELKEKTNQ